MNPVANVYCDQCHARLVTSEGMMPPSEMAEETVELPIRMQGISLPTRTTADDVEEEGDDDTPPWLHELIGSGDEGEGAPQRDEEEALAPAELPDWLSGLDAETEGEEAEVPTTSSEPVTSADDELPDWLSGLSEEPGPAAQNANEPEEEIAPTNEEDLPDWLAGLSPAEGTEVEAFAPSGAPEASAEDESLEDEALPEWLRGGEEPEEPAPEPPPAAESELPDWLQGAAPESAEEYGQEEIADGELPDWLGGSVPSSQETFAEEAEEELPDWLSGTPASQEPESAEAYGAEELPDWLSGSASEPEDAFEDEGELPDWLAGSALEEEPPAAVERGAAREEDAAQATLQGEEGPDWLADLEAPSEEEPRAEVEEELPDWLRGLEEPPQAAVEEPEAAPAPAEDLPGWLSDLEPPAEAVESVSPLGADYPAEEEGAQAPLDASEALSLPEAEEAEPAAEEEGEGALPDWLRDIAPPPDSVAPSRSVNAFLGEEEEDAAEPAPERQPAPEEEDVFEGAKSLEETEIPEWLKSLSPGESEADYEPPAEGIAFAEMPSWLQGLKPPGTGPLPQTGPLSESEVARAEEGGLARAEIPEWVKELRPTGEVSEEVAVFEAGEREPAVVEGPLAGLEGVLPALGLIDVPADFTVQRAPPLPESTVEEAQLWQHLLEQPRGRERPVARARQEQPGWQEVLLRLIILFMISVAAVLAIWELLPGVWTRAPQMRGVEVLATALDTHASGDSVILAVEYSTAYAGELDAVAMALLDQLEEQGVQVYAVTTRSEGRALIERLFTEREDLLAGENTYLPGGAAAIVPFMQSVEAERLIVVGGQASRLRWWVEQNATLGAERLPMSMGMSAAASPFMTPYLYAWDIEGWVVGYAGVASYQEVQGLPPTDEITRPLHGLMFSQWGAALLILLGSLYYLITGKRRRA
jgi:hypothetical protein